MTKSFIVATVLVLPFLVPSTSGTYNPSPITSSGGDQFHIQTDEGPERYFRYQTHNGQYRKEKRLQDGTVVGTYGWIDSTGLLRLQDYIADNAGYRILRTKDVYVGRNRPISQAIKAAKKVPGSTSVYLPPGVPSSVPTLVSPISGAPQVSTTPNSYLSSSVRQETYIPPNTYTPSNTHTTSQNTYTPQVDLTHNSFASFSTTEGPLLVTKTPVPAITSTLIPPDVSSYDFSTPTPPTVVISPKAPQQVYFSSSSLGLSSTTPLPSTPLPILPLPTRETSSTVIPPIIPLKKYFPSTTYKPFRGQGYHLSQSHLQRQPYHQSFSGGTYDPYSSTPSPIIISSSTEVPPIVPLNRYIPSSTPKSYLDEQSYQQSFNDQTDFSYSSTPSTVSVPSSSFLPPIIPLNRYVPSSTPSSILSQPSSTPIPYSQGVDHNSFDSKSYSSKPRQEFFYQKSISSTLAPPISVNSLDYYDENPYIYRNGPTYPLDRRGNPFFGNGYDPQYRDGLSVSNDGGFRYYIPRAYHEEQNLGQRKDGSFGYIDPFGIRRVVYYNAGPEGFKHRKNNRYVGFNATPYDPRPYERK